MVFLDKHGWPVERIMNRPITNFFRLLFLTKSIVSNDTWKKIEEKQQKSNGCGGRCECSK